MILHKSLYFHRRKKITVQTVGAFVQCTTCTTYCYATDYTAFTEAALTNLVGQGVRHWPGNFLPCKTSGEMMQRAFRGHITETETTVVVIFSARQHC